MATYGPMVITTLGQQALAEAQAGETLTFTRFQIGSGQLSTTLTSALTQGIAYTSLAVASTPRQINSGDTIIIGSGPTTQTVTASAPANAGSVSVSVNSFTASANFSADTIVTDITDAQNLTACIAPIDYFDVQTEYVNGNTANVTGIYSNTNLAGSTYTCEVGLYASTTTTGEVLYAYGNAGTLGDTMPPYSNGPFSRQFQISTAVSNVASVTANVPSTVYIAETEKGAANGVPTLDANGHITVSQYGNIPAANLTGGPIPSSVLPAANSTTLGTTETAQNAAIGNPIAVITNPASQATQSINGGLVATDFAPSGLTGAQTASRYVGAVSGAAPTTGTFDVGDWAVDVTNLTFWICTVAGSPGTWVNLNYLRTDSGAPNPQNVQNGVNFHSEAQFITAANDASTPALEATSPDGSYISFIPSIAQGAFNGFAQAGDQAIIFSSKGALANTSYLTIAPWYGSNAGIRIGSDGSVTAAGSITSPNPTFAGVLVFTSSGTFTVPTGVSRVFAQVWGGGGGACDGYTTGNYGGGGGGGGYAEGWIEVSAGQNISVAVGTGGTGALWTDYTTRGGAGATSNFGSYVSAEGGGGAGFTQNGGATNGTFGGAGGASALATYGATGGSGGGGTGTVGNGGSGATSFGGSGGAGSTSGTGANGLSPGGGGGGSLYQSTPGNGARGEVRVYY